MEEHRYSLSASKSRTLRIVINRPDTARPKTAQESTEKRAQELSPTLEVPIPHYRIGTFRLSSNGTPELRGSTHTRASATPSDTGPAPASMQAEGYIGAPPAASLRAFAKLEARELGQLDGHTKSQGTTSSKSTSATNSTVPSSIQPEVFDDLTAIYDDPSVVRYCQNVREITAATPARIIAQISSDSFMDYELVSDFFLTFRSYMSTYSVLDLLLARLRWAIGRLEDDGRIIRVRAFAALRHWILNYFMDDFYIDRRLRIRFCDEINKLYADVKASPENGFSDLKLLRDLKRCWNGRCSLCWNPEEFELDGDQEEDIRPGDVAEADRTPQPPAASHPVEARAETPKTDVLRGPLHSWFEADPAVRRSHDRQQSANSDEVPESLTSDASVQANSCFVPMTLLRPGGDNDVHSKAPHPVSVQLRRKNAPSNLQVVTQPTLTSKSLGHRRGASSIDSNREPTPRNTKAESLQFGVEDGDIIRGLMYSPSAPFVQIVSSHSTQSLDRNGVDAIRTGPRRDQGTQSATQPPGRNIFGSLRKVLGNKHGQVDIPPLTVSQSTQDVPARGQKSQLPLNVSKSHDELRNKAGATMARKGEIRIDLLSAAVCQNYETKFHTKHRITYGAFFSTAPFQRAGSAEGGMQPSRAKRSTAQSGSILIVDDTGLDIPSMSGALPVLGSNIDNRQDGSAPLLTFANGHITDPVDRNGSLDAVRTQRSSNVLPHELDLLPAHGSNESLDQASAGPPDVERKLEEIISTAGVAGRPVSPTTASSRTVREDIKPGGSPKPLSGDVPIAWPGLAADSNTVEQEHQAESESDSETKLPAHTLRRRPGGDLRRVENVQDLDHAILHTSLDTASAGSESPHESLLIMRTETRNRSSSPVGPPPNKPVSMINTHSSQHLRPSFEAAVAGFSAIPDDDDGGLEATLMKLEGRYEKKSPPMDQHPLDTSGRRRSLPDLSLKSRQDLQEPAQTASIAVPASASTDAQVRETINEVASEASHEEIPEPAVVEVKCISSRRSSIYGLPTESFVDSEESYASLPLLKRETLYDDAAEPKHIDQATVHPTIAPGYFPQDPPQLFHLPKGPPPSGGKNRNSFPRPSTANDSNRSFLLDEDENLSDLSSEISVDIINYSEVAGRSISPLLAAPGTAISGLEIPAHPLTYASVVNLTVPDIPERLSDPLPKPGKGAEMKSQAQPTSQPPRLQNSSTSQPLARLPAGPAHIPFVLACDSQVLAQQMTLVEKSALCEVEWSDLVEMRWDTKASEVLDWVDCLSDGKIQGIDLVSTRFNLVVKWALSEIVLTQDIHERARVITKYIHVAAHARRLHNYATMLQLTIALTSTDCTRLGKTWDMVSSPDKSLLTHMEALAQPVRNFHDLRLEMETAEMSDGCIPFLGLSK